MKGSSHTPAPHVHRQLKGHFQCGVICATRFVTALTRPEKYITKHVDFGLSTTYSVVVLVPSLSKS